ncbi:NADP-dependent oxidoreductase domain-containing protein [Stachybotrys elegans]|uniref:NADP-dependent oxidoreductase domain-containing protein n=1 Tax=Stachybotrys elegans TaxID=80388 RepID=A0A8K0SF41_9HYPO|nr:NADP-dependent oxidoreductase domain-containing protein [Stachybotrys elegans]
MSPQLRTLGRNGPQVNALGLGIMSIGGVYGAPGTDEQRFALLNRAHELGQTFWDTADIYGDTEEVIGKWFAKFGKRKDIFLATKFGIQLTPSGLKVDSSPEYVKACCNKSLQLLQVDQIDLYYCHRIDTVTPIEKTIQAMVDLKNEGKIKYIGISEVSSNTLRRAHAVHPITALQIEYSPFALEIEDSKIALLNTCRELGIAVVAYSPLGRGILTGVKTYEDFAADAFLSTLPRYSKENFAGALKIVSKLKELAEAKGCTTPQLVLAWLLAQGDDVIPIPGTRNPKYLEENFNAQYVTLSASEVQEIRDVITKYEPVGDRYVHTPENWMFGESAPL